MADIIQTPETTEPQVEKTSRFKNFTTNHPRATKVLGIAAAATVVVTVVSVVKNRRQDDDSDQPESHEVQNESSPETA